MTRDLYLWSHYNTTPFSHLLQQAVDLYEPVYSQLKMDKTICL